MSYWNDVHRTFGGALTRFKQPGMLVAGSAVVAEVDGFPLIVRDFRAGNTDHIELCLRFPEAAFGDVEWALATSDAFASAFGKPGEDPRKILKKRAIITQDNVRVRFPIRFFRRARPERIFAVARAMIGAWGAFRIAFPEGCERCQGRERCEGLTLVDGVPFRLGAGCLETQGEAERQLQRAYDAQETRTLFALATGVAVASLGAAVWAALGITLDRIFMAGGLIIGGGVGLSMGWAARRPTHLIRALAGGLGLAGVLGGQVTILWWAVRPELSPTQALLAYLGYLGELPSDETFALVSAAFGGLFAAAVTKPKSFSSHKARLDLTSFPSR